MHRPARSGGLLLLGAIVSLLAACVALPSAPPGSGEPSPLPTPIPAATAARQALAGQLGLTADAVAIVAVEAVEWPDACLGAAGPDELCAQVIVAGYRVTLAAGGKTYVYHTDATGMHVRPAASP